MDELIDDSTSTDDLVDDKNVPDDNQEVRDYLEEFVGEGKPFADVKALAKAKHESNVFIERLKEETAALRAELDKRLTFEELRDQLQNSNVNGNDHSNRETSSDETDLQNQNRETVTKDDILALLDQKKKEEQAEANVVAIHRKAQEVLGDQYKQILGRRAKELNLGKKFLEELAKENPDSFIRIMIDEAKVPKTDVVTPPRSSTSAPSPHYDGKKNYSYYQKLYRDNPREYWLPKVQNEMHAQAARMGPAFYEN